MKLRIATALTLILLISGSTSFQANSATVAGSSCTKVGSTKVVSKVKYICTKSGSKSIWKKAPVVKVTAVPTPKTSTVTPAATQSQTPTATPTASSTPTTSATATTSTTPSKVYFFTASEVKKHDSSTSCWTIIYGNVYDLTKWISRHPGGQSVIKAICGKDGTSAYTGQHEGQNRAAQELSKYFLSKLSA